VIAIAALALCAAAASPAGERLYLHGTLESGQPVKAMVEADVAITGAQVSCASCHGRSGMGSIEGRRLAPPVTTEFLDSRRRLRSRPRPAYTPQTLARAIRTGIDAGGNKLDRLMPRYRLGKRDVAALLSYLRTLTTGPSPGASDQTLELATVIAPGMPAASEQAALSVLQGFLEIKNASERDLRARHLSSWPEYFGQWSLQVWRLSGPASGWRAQLEERYRARPVFALLSGLGDDWSAVDGFCQDKHLPCLLPNVESPPEEALNEYSLYFDGGVMTEARGIAAQLNKPGARVLQIFRGAGRRAAAALAAALDPSASTGLPLGDEPLDPDLVSAQARALDATAVVLWLGPDDLQRLSPDTFSGARVFVSATSTGGDPSRAPAFLDGFAAVPGALPDDASRRFARVSSWMKARGLAPVSGLAERRIADRTLFAATTLSESVMHLHKYLLRDYLLEVIDHLTGLEQFSASFPQLSFGPGQRVLSKGCWLVPLRADGGAPEWVVP
jgi:cytochrome c553